MPAERVGILGAGRQALETSRYCLELGVGIAFYLEEGPPTYARDPASYGAPILTFADDLSALVDVPVVTAVGSHQVRQRLLDRWEGEHFRTVVSGHAWLADDARVGVGSTVAPLAALNRCVEVGEHVLVNVGAILCHDVVVGRLSTISPGCTVGGGARLGAGVFIGIGATIVDHVAVGDGAYVAAGAVVVGDVGENDTVMGVPARSAPRVAV